MSRYYAVGNQIIHFRNGREQNPSLLPSQFGQLAGMNEESEQSFRRWGRSWLLLSGALGLHAMDEAAGDFLSFYNPVVENIRRTVPYFPMPAFSFEAWITGLTAAVIILGLLSRFAYEGRSWMRPFSYIFAIVMAGNGLLHLGGTLVLGQLIPGTYSSPVLLGAAWYLLRNIPGGPN